MQAVSRALQVAKVAAAATLLSMAGAPPASTQSAAGHDTHTTATPDQLKWSQPAAYGAGAQLAVVRGDPTKEGMYVVRLKVPAGFKVGPHTHPNDENVTVLSGTFHIGTGEKLDESKGTMLKAGGYSFVGKGMAHYAWFTEETVLQLHGMGPQGITYLNPADDPRKK
jgi:quercetin dioxygenase-like cupin family protein